MLPILEQSGGCDALHISRLRRSETLASQTTHLSPLVHLATVPRHGRIIRHLHSDHRLTRERNFLLVRIRRDTRRSGLIWLHWLAFWIRHLMTVYPVRILWENLRSA